MRVGIFETDTGRMVAEYDVNLQGIGYTPSIDEAYDEAWNCAVEDDAVDADSRGDYECRVLEQR